MRSSGRGVTGFAAGLVCASVLTLVPGADAARQPTTTAPHDSARVAATMQTTSSAKGSLTSTVRGTFGKAGTVRGTFEPVRFIRKHGELYGVGMLHAVLRRGDGSLVGTANRYVTLPVRSTAAAAKTCSILHLVLGPLDLNLLGLVVHLDKVVLDITAQSGPGNLLGNLLCAVAGLLNGSPTLSDLLNVANLLNRILSILHL